jgi:signal transduction histidine kinase
LIAEVERQARELRLLHEMRTALVGVNDLEAIFSTAVESISSIFGYELVSVYRLIDNELRIQAQIGYEQFYEMVPVGVGICGKVAATGRGVLAPNVRKNPDYLEASSNVTGQVCVPLLGPGYEVLGTLVIESDDRRKLDERDYKLCQALAEHVVLAVSQALAHERERRRLTQLALLNHVGRDLASALDEAQIIDRVTGPVRESLDLYSVNIALIEGDELVCQVIPAVEKAAPRYYRWPLQTNSLACHSARSGEMIVCHDVSNEPRYLPLPEIPDTKAEVILPLRVAGEVIGVLAVASDGTRIFEDDDIILFKTLADQTSVALANARRFADLQRQKQELDETNKALAEANRLKSEFLANVSHELRTPLNSIIGYIDMIQSGFYGDLPGDMGDPIERVYRNGRRLMALINDVLDLANIEAGRLQLSMEDMLTSEVVTSIIPVGKGPAEEKGLDFEAYVMPDAPRIIHTDIQRLRQVLNSLLSNAIKFTPQGSVTLSVAPSDPAEISPGYPTFRIMVSDTGIGIPETEFEHIFEEFRQVDGSSTRQFGGTGLGLALARRLVRELGGKLSVTSQLGKGSTFTITLPVKPVPRYVTK